MSRNNSFQKLPKLEIYADKSVLIDEAMNQTEFEEGSQSESAKTRQVLIHESLENGFFNNLIDECRKPDCHQEDIEPQHQELITKLVDSITSEVGRGVVGLTILQLCIKAIAPDQSIRLHKANQSRTHFSWCEGIAMRPIDKAFITPALRSNDLLKLNADGCFMTRALAENYPYSKLYKAAIRGARAEWINIIDAVENNELDAESSLRLLIKKLINRSADFKSSAHKTLKAVDSALSKISTSNGAVDFLMSFINQASYSARLFEIAMHGLFQVLDEYSTFEGSLKPLCQMRSANKKHGNIGDIEVVQRSGSLVILESWDAKFGKQCLRDEIEELSDKLNDHSETEIAGFVSDITPRMTKDMVLRISELEDLHDVRIQILSFDKWVKQQFMRCSENNKKLAKQWVKVFAECLCQERRASAPIDEPCDRWVDELLGFINDHNS